MRDPADDGPEVQLIRQEKTARVKDWLEVHLAEVYRAKGRSRVAFAWARWLLGL